MIIYFQDFLSKIKPVAVVWLSCQLIVSDKYLNQVSVLVFPHIESFGDFGLIRLTSVLPIMNTLL